MKRHKLPWVMAAAGMVAVAAGTIARTLTPGTLALIVPNASARVVVVLRWLREAAIYVSMTHLREAAAVAWLIFVLSLIVLARSRSNKPQTPRLDESRATSVAHTAPDQQAQLTSKMQHGEIPPLPMRPAPRPAIVEHQESPRNAPHGRDSGTLAAPGAPALAAEQQVEPGDQTPHTTWKSDERTLGQSWSTLQSQSQTQSHTLALTGISLAPGRLLRYGLFIVAEDTGIVHTGEASQRAVEVVAEQITPSLTSERMTDSVQVAALLKMAVLRANIELCLQSIDTGAELGAAIAGVMVIGDVAYAVNIADCHAYVFRRRDGLICNATDQRAVPGPVGQGPLEPEPLFVYPRCDQFTPGAEAQRAAGEIGVMKLNLCPDDLVLICSSRLSQALDATQIEALLRAATDTRDAADLLTREGDAHGEKQGFSAIVVRQRTGKMAEFSITAPGTDVC
jgi:serine/threonine protein phosphatase PrpC